MSKEIVIGVDSVRYKDKESGVMVDALNLHTVKKNLKTVGVCTATIWIDNVKQPQAYEMFVNYCKGDVSRLLNLQIDVSRGNRGFLEDLEIIGVKESAALFDL
jgi:hypothetical protein